MSDTIEQPGAVAAEPGPDLRSVLDAAYDEVVGRDAEPEQRRDESGRFAAPEGAEAEADETEATDQPEAEADKPEEPAIEPPKSWSDDDKATWGELSRKAQETILRREAAIERDMSDRDRGLAPLQEVLAPYQEKHARMGLSQAEAVHRLLNAQDLLDRDPDQGFRWLMQSYGYDPRRLLNEQTQAQDTPQIHPELAALRNEIAAIKQRDQAREMQSTTAQIEAFAKDPAHPHFEAVRKDMGLLITASPTMTMQEAYEKAIWASDVVREKLLAETRAKEVEAQRKAAADQAASARKASRSVRDSAPGRGAAPAARGGSLRDDLMRAWDEAASAA